MSGAMQTVCANAVAAEQENDGLMESFKNCMAIEDDGPCPREFYSLKVSFITAESSRS